MTRFILLLSVLFIAGFTPRDDDYFRQHKDEAETLVQGRCQNYLMVSQGRMDEAFKDVECDAAAKIINEDIEVKSRQTLINAVEKFLQQATGEDSYNFDERTRYIVYGKQFNDFPEMADDLVVGCMADQLKAKQNKPACRAASESVLKRMSSEQQNMLLKLDNNEKYTDYYKHYFDEHP